MSGRGKVVKLFGETSLVQCNIGTNYKMSINKSWWVESSHQLIKAFMAVSHFTSWAWLMVLAILAFVVLIYLTKLEYDTANEIRKKMERWAPAD